MNPFAAVKNAIAPKRPPKRPPKHANPYAKLTRPARRAAACAQLTAAINQNMPGAPRRVRRQAVRDALHNPLMSRVLRGE